MRICLYTGTALPKLGGQEAVVDSLATHFTRLGHRAIVLAPLPRWPLRPNDSELPYPVYRHPRLYSTRSFVSFYRHWLLKVWKREKFDLLHCHDVYPTGYLASLCKAKITAPVVITSHGGDVKFGNIRISKRGMRPRYVQAIESADALISLGAFTSDGFAALSSALPPVHEIPNGIDLAPYREAAPRPPQAHGDPPIVSGAYLLFLGRLKYRKGLDVLLDAMARVKRPAAQCGVELVIAGSGELETDVAHQIQKLNLGSRVRCVGRVDGDAKRYFLQNARAIVMPSRGWEAFPLVLLEAWAAGRGIVGTSIPGIVDLVQEGIQGLLVPEESADALAEAIQKLLDDPALAARLGENGLQAAQHYGWDSVARRHIAIYTSLLEHSTRSTPTG